MRFLVAMVLAFLLTPALAQEPEYRLQPGDVVEIWVAQQPDLNCQLLVAPDGRVSLPMAGHLRAEDLTLEELEAALKARLQVNFKTPLDLTAILVNPKTRDQSAGTIYIVGDVTKPGEYPVRAGMTVLHAVSLAGGFLRPTQASSGGAINLPPQERLQQLKVREARLQAELDGKTDFAVPPDISATTDSALLADFVRQENLAMEARRSTNLAADSANERANAGIQASISALNEQLNYNKQESDFAEEELTSVRSLVAKGLTPSTRVTQLERSFAAIQAQRQQLMASLTQAQIKLQDLQATVQTTRDQRRFTVMGELESAQQQMRELQGSITAAGGSPPVPSGDAAEDGHKFVIFRSQGSGIEQIPAEELSPIQSGDLIKVLPEHLTATAGQGADIRAIGRHAAASRE